jgi:hypothetical protein
MTDKRTLGLAKFKELKVCSWDSTGPTFERLAKRAQETIAVRSPFSAVFCHTSAGYLKTARTGRLAPAAP